MLIKFFGTLFVLLVIFGAVAYFSGWLNVASNQDTTTIEMKTGEMKEAADDAVEKGKQLFDKAGQKLKELGDREDGQEDSDSRADEQFDPTADTVESDR